MLFLARADRSFFFSPNQEARNGASGTSDIEGKAARAAASKTGASSEFQIRKKPVAVFLLF
jgi:hypothetical protein